MDKNYSIMHLISSLEIGGAEKLLIDLIEENYTNTSEPVNYVIVVMNARVNPDLKEKLLTICPNVYFLDRPQSHKHPKYLFKLLNIIKKHNVALIHSHNGGSKLWAMLCKMIKPEVKTVFTVHDTKRTLPDNGSFKLWLHKKFIDQNIAISESVKKYCLDHKITNVIKIYNGIKISDYKKNDPTNPTNGFKIISVGRINHVKKGQDILIRALKICKDKGLSFECNFVGGIYDYSQESYTYLCQLVKELDLTKEVQFLGNRNDIPELLNQSSLFVLPSRYEGLGLVLLEAMAAGIPVIASNIDGPKELIENEENGFLFETENIETLSNKIIELYNNPEKRQKLVENSKNFVLNFDINQMSKKYIEIYNSLICNTKRER